MSVKDVAVVGVVLGLAPIEDMQAAATSFPTNSLKFIMEPSSRLSPNKVSSSSVLLMLT
jgi:hypothetical protein